MPAAVLEAMRTESDDVALGRSLVVIGFFAALGAFAAFLIAFLLP